MNTPQNYTKQVHEKVINIRTQKMQIKIIIR